jgi:hypothetical protein
MKLIIIICNWKLNFENIGRNSPLDPPRGKLEVFSMF